MMVSDEQMSIYFLVIVGNSLMVSLKITLNDMHWTIVHYRLHRDLLASNLLDPIDFMEDQLIGVLSI